MSCRTENRIIGEHEYSVTQWPAEKAILMKLKIIKIFGSSVVTLGGSLVSGGDEDIEVFAEGLTSLFNNSSPEEISKFMKSCVIGAGCGESRITESTFETLFSGDNLMDFYKVFLFVLEVNYAHLMKGQLAEQLLAKATPKK